MNRPNSEKNSYLEVDVVDVFLVKVSTEELRLSVVVFSSLLIGGEVW